jgi:prepilin-type processing-associated H-X9-DG protein
VVERGRVPLGLHDRVATEQADPDYGPPGTVWDIPVGAPSSGQVDVDMYTYNENDGGPTYAAFTTRSYHPGGVNSLFADGSVHFFESRTNGLTWRSLGTIAGGEVLSGDSY